MKRIYIITGMGVLLLSVALNLYLFKQVDKSSNVDGKSYALKGNQASAASCKQLVRYVINAFKNSDQYWESGDYSLYNSWFDNAVGLYEQGVNQGCWSPV